MDIPCQLRGGNRLLQAKKNLTLAPAQAINHWSASRASRLLIVRS